MLAAFFLRRLDHLERNNLHIDVPRSTVDLVFQRPLGLFLGRTRGGLVGSPRLCVELIGDEQKRVVLTIHALARNAQPIRVGRRSERTRVCVLRRLIWLCVFCRATAMMMVVMVVVVIAAR